MLTKVPTCNAEGVTLAQVFDVLEIEEVRGVLEINQEQLPITGGLFLTALVGERLLQGADLPNQPDPLQSSLAVRKGFLPLVSKGIAPMVLILPF